MKNIKKFIKKYRIMLLLFAALFASTFIYLYVSADEDIYDNQISATVNSVTIIDGTESFDANDDAGNDSSSSNKIVRNFDKITYQMQYSLGYKADSTLTEEQKTLDLDRNVIVDVLVPSSLKASLAADDEMNALTSNGVVTISDVAYEYYTTTFNDISLSTNTHNMEIIIFDINGKHGDIISPIIRVREASDAVIAINDVTNIEDINKVQVENVTISAKETYGIELYGVNPTKDTAGITTQFLTGIVVYLPQDETKGLKGVQVPTEVIFNVNAAANVDSTYATIRSDALVVDYNPEQHQFSGLPNAYVPGNGTSSVLSQSETGSNPTVFNIKIEGLQFHTQYATLSDNSQRYYLTSKVLVFNNDKTEKVENNRTDIEYEMTTDKTPSNSVTLLDNYVPFVGEYISNVDFKNSINSSVEEHGKAIFNYNQIFYINNTIAYGYDKGDKLENGLTHYIKIDNDAITLKEYDQSMDYAVNVGNDGPSYEVKFGLGEWTSEYFELKNDRPSYCPNSIDDLTKEQLMNYYGGPCIKEISTNNSGIVWVDSISAAGNKLDKIIIFKLNITGMVDKRSQISIQLKAQAVKNTANIGNTFAVVTRAKTVFNNSDYYLSEKERKSVSSQSADLDYSKTIYIDGVPSGDVTKIGEEVLQNNIGNTILISPFKTSINKIELRDAYNSLKNTFYSGMTDPIEIEITPSIRKDDFDATFTEATISVYLPKELEIYNKTGDKSYVTQTSDSEVTIGEKIYKVYNYEYSQQDIIFENESQSGTIPTLKLHAYIDIATPDNLNTDILVRISGKLKPNALSNQEYADVTPVEQRQLSKDICLRNTKEINAIGKSNLTRIDENGTYIYNMRATNASNVDSKLALLYILPYSGDGVGDGSKFTGSLSVKLTEALPAGYTAVYTTDDVKTILVSEINGNSTVQWKEWTNVIEDLSSVTAIKITSVNQIARSQYFVSKDGINLVVKTNGNKESENYYNNFYMIQYDVDICVYDDITSDVCTNQVGNKSFTSNVTRVSVLDRLISGYAFEDSDYSGLNENEPALSNMAVELYKLNNSNYDPNNYSNPAAYISNNDELVKESTTNKEGYYIFDGLKSGDYYVKYKFDCNKYTVAEKNKTSPDNSIDTRNMDSDANMVVSEDKSVCYAVSNIQTLNDDKIEAKNIDIGLRVKQDFDIAMHKYITNVTVTTATGTDSYDYDKQTKVKIDVRNLKNASFRVTYLIEIENIKYFPGTIGNIIESIPEGMTFDPSLQQNYGWYENEGYLYYMNLSKTLIMPGEKYYMTIVLDLTTETGGDYINFVSASGLQIQPVTTNFIDPDEFEVEMPDDKVGGGE